jgi:DNA-directed RNA polymerase subunit RPC12/RpoP
MAVTCPKCEKELVKEDIEVKKAYCQYCKEWFVLKEEVTVEKLSEKSLSNEKPPQRKKESYIVYFCLVFIMCLSIFLFSVTHPFYSSEPEGLDHAFSQSGLKSLLDRDISKYTTGLINAVFRLFAYGGMGLLGLYFSSKIGFNEILNDEIKKTKNIILIVSVGIIMGLFFLGYDWVFKERIIPNMEFIYLLKYDYSKFPSALFSSITEGIGCQILNMLRITFFIWIFKIITKSEKNNAFLFFAILCSLIFAIEHISSTGAFYSGFRHTFFRVDEVEFIVIIGLYAPLSLVCSFFIKRFGLLSGISIHLISDIIWRSYGIFL